MFQLSGGPYGHITELSCVEERKKIITVKIERKISFPEARKLVESPSPSPTSRTYAAAVKPSTRTSACQTELVWVRRDKPVTYTAPPSGPVAAQSKTTCSQSQTVSALPQVGPSTEQPSHSPTPNSLTPQTQTENLKSVQRGKPQPVAGAMGSQIKLKKKYESDRQPKGSDDPIAQANRYLLLPDDPGEVEMAEAALQGNRSRSPKKKSRGPSPVVPPK